MRRRTLLIGVAVHAGAMTLSAKAQPQVDEKDPQAAALGYVSEASKADAKRFPKFAPGQRCATCALFQAKPGDVAGPCPLFAGKAVAAAGWCSAWAKKG